MSTRITSSFIFTLIFSLAGLCVSGSLMAQTDTVATEEGTDEPAPKKKYTGSHQLMFGVDLSHPFLNSYSKVRYSYEGEINYYLKNEYYAVAEGGWGGSKVDYDDLKYTTTNSFGRLGFNKSILYREGPDDWDMMFIGLRAAMGNVSRSVATYTVADTIWGNQTGQTPARSFVAAWAEITGGMRIELLPGVLAGWNVRGKFLMNGRSFKDLSPLNIAGYGKGDKNSSFDFNVYLDYAIRWDRKKAEVKK
jgi:hypothetical protein